MHFPQFSNPHLVEQHVETVSRSALFDRELVIEQEGDESHRNYLDSLVKQTLGDINSVPQPPRKKRKHRHLLDGGALENGAEGSIARASASHHPSTIVADTNLAFRLLSSVPEPRTINLDPKPRAVIQCVLS
jgi:hypothetical protein